MTRIVAFIEGLSDWCARISAVLLGLMTLLILTEILLWNTAETSTLIADEYSAYGLAVIIFMGAGYCLKEKGHIRITLVLGFLPEKLAKIIAVIATGATTVFMGYLCWYLIKMTLAAHRYSSTSGTLTETPLWIPQAIMCAGAVVFCLQLAATTVRTVWAVNSDEDPL